MIQFNDEAPLPLSPQKSLLELAQENKIDLNHSCGGYGTCGTCRVFIANHKELPPRNEIEGEMAHDRGFEDHERLACQTQASQNMTIQTP